jgi:hypothetical protein
MPLANGGNWLSAPEGIRVNRRACRFGRYKSPRRAHPPPRASRVSCHPPQVSGLTFAHPLLTQPRSPSPTAVRSTNRLTVRGSILGPWSAQPKWAPTTVSFLAVAQNGGKVTLKMTLKLALPPSPSRILSFLNLSRRRLSVAVVCPLVRSYSTPTFHCYSLLDLLLFALNCHL